MRPPAIAALYRAFEPYRLRDDFSRCEHCVSPEASKRLAATPLEELPLADLDRYAFKAMTTWGDERHFKYFLPRLMELAWDHLVAFNDPEVLFGKLKRAAWRRWPLVEQTAIHDYLEGFWVHQLHKPIDSPGDFIHTVISALAEADDSIEPYLVVWSNQKEVTPARHLARLIKDRADEIMTTGTCRLWNPNSMQASELVAWLASDAPRRILEPFRETIEPAFPLAYCQLEGIRASIAAS